MLLRQKLEGPKILRKLMPQLLHALSVGLPSQELCNEVLRKCTCGKTQMTFGNVSGRMQTSDLHDKLEQACQYVCYTTLSTTHLCCTLYTVLNTLYCMRTVHSTCRCLTCWSKRRLLLPLHLPLPLVLPLLLPPRLGPRLPRPLPQPAHPEQWTRRWLCGRREWTCHWRRICLRKSETGPPATCSYLR